MESAIPGVAEEGNCGAEGGTVGIVAEWEFGICIGMLESKVADCVADTSESDFELETGISVEVLSSAKRNLDKGPTCL
jgi:hypothetical protein